MGTPKWAEIMEIAKLLFHERGYHGTTMREIAMMLHMQHGSLYAHVLSKQELLWEIANQTADLFLEQVESISPDAPIEFQIFSLIQKHLEIIASECPATNVFLLESRFLEPGLREQIEAKRGLYQNFLHQMIEEGMQEGIFQVSNTSIATIFILSALYGAGQWLQPEDDLMVEQMASQYIMLVMRLLKG